MASRLDKSSQTFLMLLTFGIFGLQSTLAVQTSKGSPFLLSLGLQKSFVSLIWTAGPIAGALAQPYFGVIGDQSRDAWGKRRPFIAAGAALMAPSLIGLGWVQEITQALVWLFRLDADGGWPVVLLRSIAVANIWTYFFAFQMAQVGFRALIVDCCPPELLDQAMVWATRWNCLANIVCYGAGFLDLPSLFPLLGATDFQILALSAALIITFTTVTVCCLIEEDNPQSLIPRHLAGPRMGFLAVFREVRRNIRQLPASIWTIFEVQFCAWAGWFLFNYYITTYVGALHHREEAEKLTGQAPKNLLNETSTRYGSLALLFSAVVTMVTVVLGPIMIDRARRSSSYLRHLTLRNLWFVAQFVFAASMLSTFLPVSFLHTSIGTTVLVSIVGMPWALTTWAPFSLIGEEINALNAYDEVCDDEDTEKHGESSAVMRSGTVMGLYIATINVPQFFATVSSSVIFWLTDNSDVSVRGLEWVLRLSGVAAAVAAWRILAVVDRTR